MHCVPHALLYRPLMNEELKAEAVAASTVLAVVWVPRKLAEVGGLHLGRQCLGEVEVRKPAEVEELMEAKGALGWAGDLRRTVEMEQPRTGRTLPLEGENTV